MEGKTWTESVNKFFTIKKDGRKIKRVIKLLSGVTIWGQPEAITKEMLNPLVEAYMAAPGRETDFAGQSMDDWTWTGSWKSEGGAVYGEFERKQAETSSSSSSSSSSSDEE